ncbi:MAG: hypothetical protein V4513_08400 [Pseudomonadota bacterium]
MIYRRAVAKLRAQDWFAIGVEFAIVVAGVFVGNWVNDWSQAKAEEREAKVLILRLRPQLERLSAIERGQRDYYNITRSFADTALAGWANNPQVKDKDFVIAAYQASQIAGLSIDGSSLSMALGGDSVRKISDPALREAVVSVMSYNYVALRGDSLQDDYRKHVREVIPYPIQRDIRRRCGDTQNQDFLILPPKCTIDVPPDQAAKAAAALRSHPELAGQLAYHLAQTDAWLSNLGRLEVRVRALLALMDQKLGGLRQ